MTSKFRLLITLRHSRLTTTHIPSASLAPMDPIANICSRCGQQGTLLCGRCRNARYCSKPCQKLHWAEHKLSCIDRKKPVSLLGALAVGCMWVDNMGLARQQPVRLLQTAHDKKTAYLYVKAGSDSPQWRREFMERLNDPQTFERLQYGNYFCKGFCLFRRGPLTLLFAPR